MVEILNDNAIKITRGDSVDLKFNIKRERYDSEGYEGYEEYEEYQASDRDVLTLYVYDDFDSILIEKSVAGNDTIHINPEETRICQNGEYWYNVELKLDDNDMDVYTIISKSKFIVV